MMWKYCSLLRQAEAISTGSLAGHNAVRYLLGMPLLILPRNIAIGNLISYANYKMMTKEGRRNRYTFAGAEFFQKMKEAGLYTIDSDVIKDKIERLKLSNIMGEKIV